MRKLLIASACSSVCLLVLSGCMTSTAISTGRAPTPAEAQQQLQADILALKALGCLTAAASQAAAPIIAVTVDDQGQRIAAAVDQTSGKVCSGPSKPISQ